MTSPSPGRLLRSRWIQAGGYHLHIRASPSQLGAKNPPIVCVHGFVVSSRYMTPVAELLAADHAVYVPDLPGFGRSEKPPYTLDVPQLADALAAFLTAVASRPAVLLANSFGCQIAAELALRYSETVEKMIFVGPSIDPHAQNAPVQAWRIVYDGPMEGISFFPIAVLDYADAGLCRVFGTMRVALRDHIKDKLPAIQTPTLVVRGSRDVITPQRWARQAARLLPNGQLAVVLGGAHALNFSAPAPLARLVRAFLRGQT